MTEDTNIPSSDSSVEDSSSALADEIEVVGNEAGRLQVRLSNQLIHLLSEQMYSSPLKAIEELVVNGYDADANECRVAVPPPEAPNRDYVVVYDDGTGMDLQGLKELWHVGASPKANQELSDRRGRKLIGKFGIGKLATYAIANRITYVSRREGKIYHVSCDYRAFKSNPEGGTEPVPLLVHEVPDPKVFRSVESFARMCAACGVDPVELTNGGKPTWTMCILEDLKSKAQDLKIGRLEWVLSTAMPLRSDFAVFVNKKQVKSSKEKIPTVVDFAPGEIDDSRLEEINKKLKSDWHKDGKALTSSLFPSGVRGQIIVAQRSLVAGKSADIDRSHGFFIRVRDRLVNPNDELFGVHALSHGTFNFFRADLEIDDLNTEVTAPREGIEAGEKKREITLLLTEIFNEARVRQGKAEKEARDKEARKKEHEREYVDKRLVEQPIADVLARYGNPPAIGPEADEGWFYMAAQDPAGIADLVEQLYSGRTKYHYDYVGLGATERLVKFDPKGAKFTLNDDHELVRAHQDDARARTLLEEMATAEVLLEVYMRESGIEPYTIAEVLERRDMLIRSLAQDRIYSLEAIATMLEKSADDEHNLEIAVVAAARALGFNAKHISGSSEPDGIARFNDFATGERKITLEAKSTSASAPSLGAIDFAGLAEHVEEHKAHGCLLVAPAFPGAAKDRSAVDRRASALRISCWTIADLARVVRRSEAHQISASQIIDIVLSKHEPEDVHAAVEQLLNRQNMQRLYRDIIAVLRQLNMANRLPGSVRKVQHVSALLSIRPGLGEINDEQVRNALVDMGNTSRGVLRISDDTLILLGDMDELERRLAPITGEPGQPRRVGTFRAETSDEPL